MRAALHLSGWLLLAALPPWGAPALADTTLRVPLECRLGMGTWSPCTMTIQRFGEHWWLQVGQQRLEFRSDGRGSITVTENGGPSRSVLPVWSDQQALCWDGICAKGDLPLD